MKCPVCTNVLDSYEAMTGARSPQSGDLSVCMYCGACLVFTESLQQRLATLEDLKKVDREGLVMIDRLQTPVYVARKRQGAMRN